MTVVKKVLGILGITILGIVLVLVILLNGFLNGDSQKAKSIFVTTLLETGQLKFVVSLFLNENQINEIVNANSLKEMVANVDSDLINIEKENEKKENIEIKEIAGDNFFATMMIVNDPSTVSLATTYPWKEYGLELDKLVSKSNAIAGINGGLYQSDSNKGGTPLGLTVTNGEIQHLNVSGFAGLHLIGLDEQNILKIIDLSKKTNNEVKKLVKDEKIRDAVVFQEESTDKNNHFVKLIINGEKRELNGIGSGSNPRTAIGQRKDGSIIFLVTDGRGANGHLGASASDLIEVMYEYGAINAANLDGGSSSTMYYKDKYLMSSVTLYYANSSWRLPTAFVVKEK